MVPALAIFFLTSQGASKLSSGFAIDLFLVHGQSFLPEVNLKRSMHARILKPRYFKWLLNVIKGQGLAKGTFCFSEDHKRHIRSSKGIFAHWYKPGI